MSDKLCKICKSKSLKDVINLGLQPLANKYPKNIADFTDEKFFPMSLTLCNNCLNVKIKKLIDRKEMFEDYYYLSSVNQGLVRHFKKLAIKLKKSSFVVDIGSNDGIFLKPLKEIGVNALGVDPSINVGKIANERGLETIVGFFSEKIVDKIINEYEQPDVVVASSIFTHLENPLSFAKNIKNLLKKDGIFILEVEYLYNFIENIQFERFYFDRPFYYSLNSIKFLFESVGMSLVDIEFIDIHGGSIRCFIKNNPKEPSKKIIDKILIKERENLNYSKFLEFNEKIKKESKILKENLENLKNDGKKVIGYGAPARVATITNYAKINSDLIEFIIDDSELKQNRFSPGMHIPIKDRKEIINKKVDVIIVFAYEYFKDIKRVTKKLNSKYYKPIPFQELI